jgi:hypothetical protein
LSSERLRELLGQLDRELKSTGDIDAETRELLAKLNADLEALTVGEDASAGDRAKELESRFAASHPVAERITREIADLLAKMGI